MVILTREALLEKNTVNEDEDILCTYST